jgi:hypothetical protein
MENNNYNLIKLLHNALDTVWRIEKHYQNDSQNLNCACSKILKEIKDDNQKHVEKLLAEIKKHDQNNTLN